MPQYSDITTTFVWAQEPGFPVYLKEEGGNVTRKKEVRTGVFNRRYFKNKIARGWIWSNGMHLMHM